MVKQSKSIFGIWKVFHFFYIHFFLDFIHLP